MSARLIEIFLPDAQAAQLEAVLARHSRRFWREVVPGGQEKYSCIVQQRYTERLLEDLEREFADAQGFSAHVLKLEAVLPAVVETAETELPPVAKGRPQTALERFFTRDRITAIQCTGVALYTILNKQQTVFPQFLGWCAMATGTIFVGVIFIPFVTEGPFIVSGIWNFYIVFGVWLLAFFLPYSFFAIRALSKPPEPQPLRSASHA